MPHLEPERLAAFDHERFTEEEQAHLASCATCQRELEAMAALVTRAGMMRAHHDPDGPLLSFEQIMAGGMPVASHGESVARSIAAPGQPHASVPWGVAARRVAAALVLMAGGVVVGRLTSTEIETATATAVDPVAPLTTASATALLDRAQRDYERAALWLAANDSIPQSSEVYRARLAALDEMMAASRAALREAPQDLLLNHYFLSAWAAREATLQQLGAALPVDKLVERY